MTVLLMASDLFQHSYLLQVRRLEKHGQLWLGGA